jgi:arylsulfatase A-like enzyme
MGKTTGLTRRRFITSSAATTAMVTVPGAQAAFAAAGGQRPNILLVITDDQPEQTDWAMLKTRKWLAEHGVEFAHAHCTTPICAPARASIFTGRYAHNHGVRDNLHPYNLDQATTVQRQLQQAGYRTGLFGKYLNTWNIKDNPPGFDEWAMLEPGYVDGTYNVNGKVQTIRGYTTNVVKRRTLRFLSKSTTDPRPWFACVTPYGVHSPNIPERKYGKRSELVVPPWDGRPSVFETDKSDKPAYIQKASHTLADGQAVRDRQLRTLRSVDDAMQAFRRKLTTLGQLDNTLVIYISDNGRLWADHGRLAKSVPYAPAHEVPFYLSWPAGGLGTATTDNRLVANIDIAPTIFAAAGVSPSSPHDGRSLLSSYNRDHLLLEWWRQSTGAPAATPETWASYLSATRQYVEYYDLHTDTSGRPVGTGGIVFREYYDLVRDPFQLENLLYRATPTQEQALGVPALAGQLATDRTI